MRRVAVVDRLWFGGELPAHRLRPVEVAAPLRRRAPRRGRGAVVEGIGPARLHGQPRTRRRGARRHEPRQGVGGRRRQDVPRHARDRRQGPGRGGRPATGRRPSKPTTSSSRPGRRQRCRRSTVLPRRSPGRTARRRLPGSCHARSSSSAAGRRASSWPRCLRGSASRRRSASPDRGSSRPTTPHCGSADRGPAP